MVLESSTPGTLAERLNRNRRRLFIGRGDEKAALEAFAVAPFDQPGLVAHLCAPGGVGKTTLLQAFVQDTQYAYPLLWLDARDIPADPAMLAGAIEGLRQYHCVSTGQPHLLIIDTFEYLESLEAWLREQFLPAQAKGFRVILAGRNQPALEWRTDPVWIDEHRYWVLSPFSDAEVSDYLALRGVDESNHERACRFSRGNPLALALFTDSIKQINSQSTPGAGMDLASSWRQRLVSSFEDPGKVAALEACCVVRQLDEPMLARMLDTNDAATLFQWLQSQSYVEAGNGGLFPHDLMRQAFIDELKQRKPGWLMQLGDRAFSELHDRLDRGEGDRLSLIQDAFFLLRDVDIQQDSTDSDASAVYVDAVRQADWPAIDAMTRRHENEEAVELVHQFHTAQPDALKVLRESSGKPLGFFQLLRVDLLPRSCVDADPVCLRFLTLARDCFDHEGAVLLTRFWLHADDDMEASAVYTQAFSRLAFLAVSAAPALVGSRQGDTPAWRQAMERFGHYELEIEEGTRRGGPAMFIYQDMTADARAGIDWMRRAYRYAFGLEQPLPGKDQTLLPGRDEFQKAVRQAFRHATRLDRLQNNRLLDSQLVATLDGGDDCLAQARGLQQRLADICAQLESVSTTQSHARVLQLTYLKPAPNQQAAAERLALSYATYRRRLTEALKLVESELWAEELKLRER